MGKRYKIILLLIFLGVYGGGVREAKAQQVLAMASVSANSVIEDLALTRAHPVLVELLAETGLGSLLSGAGPYTLFAPSEAACQALRGQRPERIRAVLSLHIVDGKYEMADLREGTRLRTLSGESLLVLRKKEALFLNGVRLVTNPQSARNGIWHRLDDLLMPKHLL